MSDSSPSSLAGRGLRIAFMGTPDFSVPALHNLLHSRHQVVAVYTQPPRPKGRGRQVQMSPVHTLAQTHGIPVFTPSSLKKDPAAQAEFAALNLDVAVVAAYGLILPKAVLDAPRYGCLNIHASLLPRWRGASPIQHAIWKGDTESGITIMQMDEGLDTGPMIAMKRLAIHAGTTAQSLHDGLSALGSAMIEDVLDLLADTGALESEIQPEDGSTYAPMLKKEDGRIDWTQTAADIDRQVRALTPWPGTFAQLPDGQTLKILAAHPGESSSNAVPGPLPGTFLDRSGRTACEGGSVLILDQVLSPGGKKTSLGDLVNGGLITVGDVLS